MRALLTPEIHVKILNNTYNHRGIPTPTVCAGWDQSEGRSRIQVSSSSSSNISSSGRVARFGSKFSLWRSKAHKMPRPPVDTSLATFQPRLSLKSLLVGSNRNTIFDFDQRDGYETDDEETFAIADGMATVAPVAVPPTTRNAKHSRHNRQKKSPIETVPNVQIEHPALQLLKQRAFSGSQPGHRTDSFKLGLVVEGGGMRGCVSGGALQALADLGLRDVFDAVYGASAGALNATYFLSGQRDGVEIYHDYIANERFIDLKRLWRSGDELEPALNLTYLIDHVMEIEHPLNWDAVLNSSVPLKVVASSLDRLVPTILENFDSKEDLANCLRASANVPQVAGEPILHRGESLVDAAVFEAIPFRLAIADGCTHVITLNTRPIAKQGGGRLKSALRDALHAAIKRAVMSPDYMLPAWQAEVENLVKDGCSQDEMLARALEVGASSLPWFAGAHVYPIYPRRKESSFSPLCTDVPTLKLGVAEGRRMVMEVAHAVLGEAVPAVDGHRKAGSNIMPLPPSAMGRVKVIDEGSTYTLQGGLAFLE